MSRLSTLASLKGVSPEGMALTISLGFVLGLFPVMGCATLLCALAAGMLRLNIPAIQAVNYLVYPLQLAMLAPFVRLGGRLFGDAGRVAMPHLAALLHAGAWRTAMGMCAMAAHAVAGWFCVCAPAGLALYLGLSYLLRRRLAPAGDACR